jgi:hypothetical protein
MDQTNPALRLRSLVSLGYGLGAYVAYAVLISVLLLHLVSSVSASAAPSAGPFVVRSLISPTNIVVISILSDDGYASVTARCTTTNVVSADVIMVSSIDEQERLLRALNCR